MEPESPWASNPDNIVLRHSDTGRKWFGLITRVDASLLKGINETPHKRSEDVQHHRVDILNLKAEPTVITALVGQPGFAQAYHMNKTHWITVLLDGTVDFAQIEELIDTSYDLTAARPRKTHRKPTRCSKTGDFRENREICGSAGTRSGSMSH